MTREEALKWFKDHTIIDETKDGQAHEWAIKALSEQTICHIENNTKESDLVYRPSADDTFCKSQLITCNRVKECNGVCPFEDALKHADKTQTMNDQHTVDHDRNWIIGCIEHDGFIKTDRFDKANQIILDALSAEAVQGWIPCSERLPEKGELVLVTVWNDVTIAWRNIYGGWDSAEDMYEKGDVIAWMPLPKPYREESEVEE